MKTRTAAVTRRASAADADGIAAAHIDSIHSVGSRFYSNDVVSDWTARISSERYVEAMERGEVFYVAIGADSEPGVLGFSSHRIEDGLHRTAVYVRGAATRSGIGCALFRLAQETAVSRGASAIHVDSSLAAVGFYKANGFEAAGRGEHLLWSGRTMACVFMRKTLNCGDAA